MSEFLFDYHPVHPTTWAYLSSLLMLGLFFKFSRFWSVRNLDLFLLILLAPGMLLVHLDQEQTRSDVAQATDAEDSAEETADTLAPLIGAGSSTVDGPTGPGLAAVAGLSTTQGSQPVPLTTAAPPVRDTVDSDSGELKSSSFPTGSATDESVSEADGSTEATLSEPPDQSIRRLGYILLLCACGLLLVRLLLDPTMVRRPLLEPNLSVGGLTFIGISLLIFLMANIISTPTTEEDLQGAKSAENMLARVADEEDSEALRRTGPGNALLHLLPSLVTMPERWGKPIRSEERYIRVAKIMAILSHLAVVIGIVAIGYRHFGNLQMGIGAATLYLMLPYTAEMTGRVDHVLPAALLIWAVLFYRNPLPAGMFIGLAFGVVYYPLFLLPLWMSFYWQRGLMRFSMGVVSMLLLVALSLSLVSSDLTDFLGNVQKMFGVWFPEMRGLNGIWGLGWDPIYRLPVLAAFIALSGTLALWPAQKNLGTLLSCSAAVMVATQFWHGYGGGMYMAWFLPLTLLTIFRPNLEDRVALSVLGAGWFPRRRNSNIKSVDIAA